MTQVDEIDLQITEHSDGISRRVLTFARRWPLVPLIILVILIVSGVFAPLLAPYDPTQGDLEMRLIPPAWDPEGSMDHILGTDPLGRDVLSRLIFGARISLMIAAIVLSFGVVGGVSLGLVAGYYGGQIDELAMRFVDFTLAIPFILVALVTVIVLGQSLTVIIGLLVIFSWSGFARHTRAETLQLKTMGYVEMARVTGASTPRILFRHILPGVVNTVVVITTFGIGGLILTEATLSFLGVGVPPPTPAWGIMVSDGRQYITTAYWVTVFPGVAIMLTVLSMNFLGDWLRDRWDPRLTQLL
jgi:peptide/nickel transport system permease protein